MLSVIYDLKQFCKANNIKCSTCVHSYKNYQSPTVYHRYCITAGQVEDNDVCVEWKREIKEYV